METQYYSKGIPLRNIRVTDRFFKRCIDTVRKEVIPYQWSALNDEVEGAPPSFCMRNFRIAAAAEKRRRDGKPSPFFRQMSSSRCRKKAGRWKTVFMDLYFRIRIFLNGSRRSDIRLPNIRTKNWSSWRIGRLMLFARRNVRTDIWIHIIASMICPSVLRI